MWIRFLLNILNLPVGGWFLFCPCFTAFVVNGFIPNSMMTVLLAPVIKDKAGKVGSSGNYRPIALASMLCKVVEHIFLTRLGKCITATDNQFDFRANHGTDMCIFSLKELLSTYRNKNSTVLMCFRDAGQLLNVCSLYGDVHDVKYNSIKV